MNRIEIRGVIVPSDYDDDWYQEYIDKGIITPESTFRAALDAADPAQPLDVYINSPGGSVFSANEMANAVRAWKMASGQPVNVTVGAMAASAASAFSIAVADSIAAHANAKMMFHGAYTGTLGGAQAHGDTAELLDKINADIRTTLVSRYGMDPDTVAGWFAEGREGWLNADEMAEAGIASGIIGEDADEIDFDTDEIRTIENHGLKIAAFAAIKPPEADNDGADDAGDDTATGQDQAGDGSTGEPPADPVDAESPLYLAGREAGRTLALAEAQPQIDALTETVAARDATVKDLQSQRDKLQAQVENDAAQHEAAMNDLQEKLQDANDRHARLTAGSLRFSPGVGAAPETWAEAVKLLKDEGASDEDAYVAAAKAYPQLRDEYNRANQGKIKT